MTTTRKQYSPKFKARVALEAIRGERTLNQLASQHPCTPCRSATGERQPSSRWRNYLWTAASASRATVRERRKRCSKRLAGSRWSWTGLKTKLVCSIEDRRALVELAHPDLSIRRQCELLGVNRARLYYQPGGESEENLRLMRLLDEQYTRTPFYGRRRMTVWLRSQGFEVNPKRVVRLMERIGIASAYRRRKLRKPRAGPKCTWYRLEGVEVNRVNQVWSTDITYIRMAQGFVT